MKDVFYLKTLSAALVRARIIGRGQGAVHGCYWFL